MNQRPDFDEMWDTLLYHIEEASFQYRCPDKFLVGKVEKVLYDISSTMVLPQGLMETWNEFLLMAINQGQC
jgi:hypothetical protein